MNDLHEALDGWLAAGARGEPARDVAIHAWGCDECLRRIAAFDALLAVDVAEAPEPPMRITRPRPPIARSVRLARAAAGAMAVVFVLVAGVVAGTALTAPREREEVAVATPSPQATLAEGVLSGVAKSSATPEPSPSSSATEEASQTPQPTQEPVRATAAPAQTPFPVMGGGPPPPPPAATLPPVTPAPVAATPPPAPVATPVPTPQPTPVPPPLPSATPVPTCDPLADPSCALPSDPALPSG